MMKQENCLVRHRTAFEGWITLETGSYSKGQMQIDDRYMAEEGVKSRCKPSNVWLLF